jgi:hypothetical protein
MRVKCISWGVNGRYFGMVKYHFLNIWIKSVNK